MAATGKKNWLVQNWVWAVPVGVLVLASLAAALLGPRYIGTAAAIRKTNAYKEAILRVARNPQVRRQLGDPIEAGSSVEGNLQITSNQRGFADFTIPVTGPKGKGTISVEAVLLGGTWQYQYLALQVEGESKAIIIEGQQPELDLSPKPKEPKPGDSPQGQLPDIPTGNSPPTDPVPPQGSPQPETQKPETPKPEASDAVKSSAPEASKDSP